jgi:rubredoxin
MDNMRRTGANEQRACPRCHAIMKDVVHIAPVGPEPGLIAFECPSCRYVLSDLVWDPQTPNAANQG